MPERTPRLSSGTTTPTGEPEVTVVVVTYRGAELIPDCLASLAAQTVPHRLLIVDNASTDGTATVLAERVAAQDIVRLPVNAGFAGGVATALALVRTRFCALLNDDAVADPDWLEQLLAVAAVDRDAAAWTSLMVLADRPDTVNNIGAGVDEHWYGIDIGAGLPIERIDPVVGDVFGFCGGAALLRTASIRAVGGFPAEYFLYYEDLDTSWRLRLAGWSIRVVPAARVVHRHAATSDRRSAMFHFHNERNRLFTLVRCAPAAVATGQLARFALTTWSLAVARVLRRPIPVEQNFRVRLRLRVAAAVLRQIPSAMLRRQGTRSARLTVARTARTLLPSPLPDRSVAHRGISDAAS